MMLISAIWGQVKATQSLRSLKKTILKLSLQAMIRKTFQVDVTWRASN